MVLAAGCKLWMDGRGAWRDNVFVERLWRSVTYERVNLNGNADLILTHWPPAELSAIRRET